MDIKHALEITPEEIKLKSLADALGVALREKAEDAGIKAFKELDEHILDSEGYINEN